MRKEVLIMPQNYTPEFKKKIVRLHEEEGRTYKSIYVKNARQARKQKKNTII